MLFIIILNYFLYFQCPFFSLHYSNFVMYSCHSLYALHVLSTYYLSIYVYIKVCIRTYVCVMLSLPRQHLQFFQVYIFLHLIFIFILLQLYFNECKWW